MMMMMLRREIGEGVRVWTLDEATISSPDSGDGPGADWSIITCLISAALVEMYGVPFNHSGLHFGP